MDGITDSMDMSLSKLREMMKDRASWHAPWGLKESDMTEVTEHIHINIILPQETRQNTNKQPDLTPIEQLEKEQTKPKVSSVQFSCSVMSDSL